MAQSVKSSLLKILSIGLGIVGIGITIIIGGYILGEKKTQTPVQKVTAQPSPADATANWKTYTNTDAKISIETPAEWKVTEEKPNAEYKGILLEGKEGQVGIRWGAGFGGGCPRPQNQRTLKLYNETVHVCDVIDDKDTEHWSLFIGKINNIGYSGYATANKPYSSNRVLVLKILSTLKFTGQNQTMDPASWKIAGIDNPEDFKNFFANFEQLVKEDQKFDIAELIRYPMNGIKDQADFVERYDQIFTEEVKTAVIQQDVEKMFKNYQGVMVGNGEIWFSAIGGKNEYWITAINN